MTTNKIIAEKINVFLNLLFHLEDYITNQEQREEQLHVSDIVKKVLGEVVSSEKVKNFFFKGADINNEIIDEENIEPIFRLNKLTEEKIKYIKKVNPQSFNQKNLEVLNYFYNSSGESDMIYDLTKMKIFSIIKFCLTHIMQKKYKEKEKENFSKINFALINKNSFYRKLEFEDYPKDKGSLTFMKNRSISNIRDKFAPKPNFVITPPLVEANFKNKNFPRIQKYNKNIINAYNKTGFAKNYKIMQKERDEEKNSKLLNSYNNLYEYQTKIKIPQSSKIDLLNILHNMKKRPIFSRKDDKNNMKRNNNIKIVDNSVDNNPIYENNKEKKFKKNKSEKKYYLKKEKKDKKDVIFAREFDYNRVFNMFDALKKRGYLY